MWGQGGRCPTAGRWGLCTSIRGSGLLEARGAQSHQTGPRPVSRRARALDKGVFILATDKATVAGDSVSHRPWPPPPYPAGSSHLQQILPGFADVMNTSAQAVCVQPGACFSHSLPQEGSPVSRRPAPVTSLPEKPLETGAHYTCSRIFMLMERKRNSRIAAETFADGSCPGSHDLERTPHHQSFQRPPRPAEVGDRVLFPPHPCPCVCSQTVNAQQ